MRYTFQGEGLAAEWIGSHQTMMWNLCQVGSWSHDVGHHCDVVWELCNCCALTSGCALGKARAPNIHYKPCTTIDGCHPRCWELQGQHHGIVLAFVRWAAGLTCLRTLPFARCCQDFGLGLNCFVPHVSLWNGARGYHCGQMCFYNNQWGKDICHRWIDWQ